MIAPDLRGFGDSGLAPDDRYDAAAHARDMEALLRELGHERCVVCAGDLGGVVAQDLSLRFEGLVDRLVLFNTIAPILPAEYEAAGLGPTPAVNPQTSDYFVRQSRDADGLAAELDTPERRRAYVAQMYGPAALGRPGRVHARGDRLPDRAVRRRGSLPRLDRQLRVRGRRAHRAGDCRGCSSATRRPRWCCTAPRTT